MSFAPSYFSGDFLHDVLTGTAAPNWTTNTFKAALFTGLITGQDADAMEQYGVGAYASNEAANSGTYAAGGAALTTPSLVVPTSGVVAFKDTGAASLAWTGVTYAGSGAPRGLALYDDTLASPNANPLVCAINFGADLAVTAGTLTVVWNTTYGIFYFQYA